MNKRDPLKHKAYNAAYYAKHADRIRERKRQQQAEYRRRFPEKAKESQRKHYASTRTGGRWKSNGFTPEQYEKAFTLQNGHCAICKTDLRELPRRKQQADHCHATQKPRGVLCQRCNWGLGHFKDDPALLAAAIRYLAAPTLKE